MKKIAAVHRHISFPPGQHRAIESKANQLGMTFSAFVRFAALQAAHANEKRDWVSALTDSTGP